MAGSKRGPSVWQPYRDLAKLLRKGSTISDQASWVFRGAQFVAFACYLTVPVIVPIITSTPGLLLDLSGAAMLLLAFACLASKLFNRYVAYYGAQSVVLSFADREHRDHRDGVRCRHDLP